MESQKRDGSNNVVPHVAAALDAEPPPTGPPAGSPVLNRLANLAARLVGAPSAQVSLLGDDQLILAGAGLAPGAIGTRTALRNSLCQVTVQQIAPLIVADARTDARLADRYPVVSGAVRAYLGVTLPSADKRFLGALCVFDPQPRTWLPGDISALVQLAEAVLSEMELAELTDELQLARMRGGLAVQAAGIGTFDWDLSTARMTWDQRMHELMDSEPGSFDGTIEAFESRLPTDDVTRIHVVLRDAMESRGEFDLDFRVHCRDATVRFVQARGRVLADERDEPSRVLGAAYDLTQTSAAETRVSRLLERMPAAFYALDTSWRLTFVNRAAESLMQSSREDLLGKRLWDVFPAFRGSVTDRYFRQAMETGSQVTFEQSYVGTKGPMVFEIQAWAGPEGLSVYASDITERRLEQEQAEQAAERTALLSTLSVELAGTLEVHEMMRRVAKLVVPILADWCLVTLLDAEGPSRWQHVLDVASWHSDSKQRLLLAEFAAVRQSELTWPNEPLGALLKGKLVDLPRDATQAVSVAVGPGRARELLHELAPVSLRLLPLRAHGRTVGLLSLFGNQADAPFDEAFATQIAERAALALDNARLYAEQRRLAEGLQRSLLTAPPQPDHVQIAVRYESAAEVAQVGGDWYDAFLQRDGATVLVIGDVVGHDTVAAAAMGQVRGLLRAIGARDGDPPIQVLTELDAVMEVLEVDTTATAVVARLEQDGAQRARDETTLRWSNAGHPPPMVIYPDGVVRVLDPSSEQGADLLLGIDPSTDRVESIVSLPAGSTVLLYTDGLVERRSQSLDVGLSRLCELLAELADLPLEDLCEHVLHSMLPDQPEDDVALLAVRLHPHD